MIHTKKSTYNKLYAYLLMNSFEEGIHYNFAYSNCWSSRI